MGAVEGALLAAHLIGYADLLSSAMPVGVAAVFALLHHALFGLHLGCSFAPNHKGMPMPEADGERRGHLRCQVLTSRNVLGGRVTDWSLGGLNYLVEHHLFPSMPRHSLRLTRPVVRERCHRLGVPYTEAGLIDSNVRAAAYARGRRSAAGSSISGGRLRHGVACCAVGRLRVRC